MAVLFLKRALPLEDLALADADIQRSGEIPVSQIRERDLRRLMTVLSCEMLKADPLYRRGMPAFAAARRKS